VAVLIICFSFRWTEREIITDLLILIAVRKPILDLFWLARVKAVLEIMERDRVK